ncbi:STAS domain-containing protein [Actinosynnema sp. NPDC050436]|uniref:STAS domain-containing protein n=1 Tax=Actinosynnema sp. NPDC050436 TaxID=3155659 RepID=UPI0033D10CD9
MTSVQKALSPPPDGALSCTVRRVPDGTPVVEVLGDVDAVTARELRTAGVAAVDDAGGGVCVLDLSAVTFLNAAGLSGLVSVVGHARARGRVVRIVVDSNRRVIRPIEVTALDHALSLFHTVEEALATTA